MRVIAVVVALACVRATPADACATAPPRGQEAIIADEEAVIVWNPDSHVEHFIRKAAFLSSARSFGFLVPTPTVPKLAEFDDGVFDRVAEAIRPRVVDHRTVSADSFVPLVCSFVAMSKSGGGFDDRAVRVISETRVAGFDATTVEADDAHALASWLELHGFATSPELEQWLARYVADHWKLTAFVIANDDASSRSIASRTVDLAFTTDRPFYPYREPAAAAEPAVSRSRRLRVSFLSTKRYDATMASAPWVGRAFYAAPLHAPVAALTALIDSSYIATVFDDTSSPRIGTDEVYFAPSADQSRLEQPDIVRHTPIPLPLDALMVIAVVALLVVRLRRRHLRGS